MKEKRPTVYQLYQKNYSNSLILESPNAEELSEIFKSKLMEKELVTDIYEIEKFLNKYENRACGEQLKFF